MPAKTRLTVQFRLGELVLSGAKGDMTFSGGGD